MIDVSQIGGGIPASMKVAFHSIDRIANLSPVKEWRKVDKNAHLVAKHSIKHPGCFDIYYYVNMPKCMDRVAIYKPIGGNV